MKKFILPLVVIAMMLTNVLCAQAQITKAAFDQVINSWTPDVVKAIDPVALSDMRSGLTGNVDQNKFAAKYLVVDTFKYDMLNLMDASGQLVAPSPAPGSIFRTLSVNLSALRVDDPSLVGKVIPFMVYEYPHGNVPYFVTLYKGVAKPTVTDPATASLRAPAGGSPQGNGQSGQSSVAANNIATPQGNGIQYYQNQVGGGQLAGNTTGVQQSANTRSASLTQTQSVSMTGDSSLSAQLANRYSVGGQQSQGGPTLTHKSHIEKREVRKGVWVPVQVVEYSDGSSDEYMMDDISKYPITYQTGSVIAATNPDGELLSGNRRNFYKFGGGDNAGFEKNYGDNTLNGHPLNAPGTVYPTAGYVYDASGRLVLINSGDRSGYGGGNYRHGGNANGGYGRSAVTGVMSDGLPHGH